MEVSEVKNKFYWGSYVAGLFLGWLGYFALLCCPGDNAGRAKAVTFGWLSTVVLVVVLMLSICVAAAGAS